MREYYYVFDKGLAAGLRTTANNPRNQQFLIQSSGMLPEDGVLRSIDTITLLTGITTLGESFPYPQIFVFTNVTIVCTETMIFEWVSGALVHKLTVSAGSTWVALDFYDYVYLSNGNVAVVRDAGDKTYSETSDLPTAMAAFNFNGQVILGSPDAGYES